MIRSSFSRLRIWALPAVVLLVALAVPTAGTQTEELARGVGLVQDWSMRHVFFPRVGTMQTMLAVQRDPRAFQAWQSAVVAAARAARLSSDENEEDLAVRFSPRRPPLPALHRDWSISLGTGTTATGQYPAKFSFNVNAAASCANDFIVFPVDVKGGAAQPNIVAFNNLYSGTAGANGICNRTPSGSDTGVAATVLWSYNVNAIGGAATNSPVLSLDGTRVAFIESAAGSPAHFHVLAWKSLDGQNAGNLQSVTSPKAVTTFSGTAPAAGSGTASDLALGASATGTDTISSPYVDYVNDKAYVGNDIGVLYRIENVFCTTGSCGNAAPSLDASWGTAGAVNVPCAATLTGPVLDSVTSNVFVGCSDGKVYGFSSTGTPLATASITVGNGSATGGVVDPPLVDVVNARVYAASGTGAGGNTGSMVVLQATTSLGGPCAGSVCVATTGVSGVDSARAPAFNNAYLSGSGSSTTWLIYQMGYSAAAELTLYAVTFNASYVMTAGAAADSLNFGTHVAEFAPPTEFSNAGTDRLFFGVLHSSAIALNLGAFPINSFPTALPPGVGEGNGPTGMIVDNVSTSAQASSLYFGVLSSNTAVKLTQAGLE